MYSQAFCPVLGDRSGNERLLPVRQLVVDLHWRATYMGCDFIKILISNARQGWKLQTKDWCMHNRFISVYTVRLVCVSTQHVCLYVLLFNWNSSPPHFAGKLAHLTKEIDAALLKGIQTLQWNTFRSSHLLFCLFCDLCWNICFKSLSESLIDSFCTLSFFFFFYQEIFKLQKHYLPKWNTMQTSRRKWRRNFLN